MMSGIVVDSAVILIESIVIIICTVRMFMVLSMARIFGSCVTSLHHILPVSCYYRIHKCRRVPYLNNYRRLK